MSQRSLALRRYASGWVIAALCIALFAIGCGAPTPRRLNVILVSLDTLRADHLGLYGYRRNTSPNLDALAKRSIVFDHAISPASATQPSHNSLYQSRIPSHTRWSHKALPEIFAENGYRTAGFTGNGNVSERFGFARGFEVYEEDPEGFVVGFPKLAKWLEENDDDPFFVFFHSFDIHHPYVSAEPYGSQFFPEYRGKVTGKKTLHILSKIRRIFPHKNFAGEVELSSIDRAKIVALYDGGVLLADHYIGELVKLLENRRLLYHTIVIVLADHGEEFWEHENVTHAHTLYDEVLHVPLLWYLPDEMHAGLRISRRVHLMDVAPTLLELVGLPAPESYMGTSLLPFARIDGEGLDVPEPSAIVSEMYTLKSLIDPPWKIIKEYPDGKRQLAKAPIVLYDIESDPGETRNLAAQNPETAARLEAMLEATIARDAREQVRDVPKVVNDPELRRQLEALGYVIGDPDGPAAEPD